MPNAAAVRCAACGFRGSENDWPSYWCPACGAFHREEFVKLAPEADRERVAAMTEAEAAAEFAAAGVPVGRHDWPTVRESVGLLAGKGAGRTAA